MALYLVRQYNLNICQFQVHFVETQHEDVDRIRLAWDRVQWRASENRIGCSGGQRKEDNETAF